MYSLVTSTGFSTQTSTVEQVASALARQLNGGNPPANVRWTITTPHGTVLSDTVPDLAAGHSAQATADLTSAHLEHAYGLLVRDHLTRAKASFNTGLFHTMSRVGSLVD